MFDFTSDYILSQIVQFIWPFFRITSMFMVITIIGTKMVPARFRVIFSIILTAAIFQQLPPVVSIEFFSLAMFLVVLREILIGIILGFIMQIIFQAFVVGGQLIGMQGGLGFATMVDPANSESVPFVSQLYLMMVTLLYLAADGHLVTIELIADSFTYLPIGLHGIPIIGIWEIIKSFSWIFVVGMLIAMPAVVSLLVMNIAFGVMTRAAPQLNIFTVGFPITLTFAVFIMYLTLPVVVHQFNLILEQALDLMKVIIRSYH